MKILFLGDIFSKSGREVVKKHLHTLKETYSVDLVIANGENSAHGKGMTKKIYEELMDIAANIGNIPSPFVDAKAQFYIGYYHQKTEIAKCEDRVRIGKRIAEIRQAKGLSIRQLADASGVNFANIYKIENGKYNVSIDILGKICEALGCRIDIVEDKI